MSVCLSVSLHVCLWLPYMCACDCQAVAHVAQSRPWCLLASCPPSDLCPEWIKPGLSALDDWSSFQHHRRHWHHTLSPASRDCAPFLASECEPHVKVLATRKGSFSVLKVWMYSTSVSQVFYCWTRVQDSKESKMPPLTVASCSLFKNSEHPSFHLSHWSLQLPEGVSSDFTSASQPPLKSVYQFFLWKSILWFMPPPPLFGGNSQARYL